MRNKRKNKIKILSAFLAFIFLFVLGSTVLAQTNYVPLAPLPEAAPETGIDFENYILGMIRLLIGVAGVLAIIVIMIGGVKYLTAGDSQDRTGDARDQITKAIWGLILAIGAWLILNTINPNILNIGLNPPAAELPPAPGQASDGGPGAPPPPQNFPPDNGVMFCYTSNIDCGTVAFDWEQGGTCDPFIDCRPMTYVQDSTGSSFENAFCFTCINQ